MTDMAEAWCRSFPGDVLRDVTTSVVGGVNSLIPEEKRKVEEVCFLQDLKRN